MSVAEPRLHGGVGAKHVDAIVELDQVANAEGCSIAVVQTFRVHFTLTDRGELVLDGFGEGTKEEMISFAYPRLDKALEDAWGDADSDGYESLSTNRRAAIAHAVEQERTPNRARRDAAKEPLTEPPARSFTRRFEAKLRYHYAETAKATATSVAESGADHCEG